MNAEQRTRLKAICDDISALQNEEQDKLDNLPENLQNSDNASQMQDAVDHFQEAIDALESIE